MKTLAVVLTLLLSGVSYAGELRYWTSTPLTSPGVAPAGKTGMPLVSVDNYRVTVKLASGTLTGNGSELLVPWVQSAATGIWVPVWENVLVVKLPTDVTATLGSSFGWSDLTVGVPSGKVYYQPFGFAAAVTVELNGWTGIR